MPINRFSQKADTPFLAARRRATIFAFVNEERRMKNLPAAEALSILNYPFSIINYSNTI